MTGPARRMSRGLTVLNEVIGSNTIDGEHIVLNRKQCRHLAHTCMSTLNQLSVASLPDHLKKEFHGTVLESVSYFKSCTEGLWLRFLATNHDPQEAYLHHLKDVTACMATSIALNQCRQNALPFIDCFIQSMADCESGLSASELQGHIRADQQEMLGLLCSVQAKYNVPEGLQVDQVSKKGCLCFSFKRKTSSIQPSLPSVYNYRLAAFLAQKCDEMLSLSASPKSVPETFCIDPKDLCELNCSPIGEEGFSKVYEQTWLDQRVAVKEFDTGHESFVKETSLLAGLSNPYVIKLIGWSRNQAKGTYSLVMERMDGGLHDYLSSNSPSLEVAVDIMLQIARGMEYLHAMNVMHRDLKPANVLVRACEHKSGYLRIKLADFGVAKYQPDTPFFSTERQGTWYYRAPEVLQYTESIEGEGVNCVFKKYTLKADVFSFAILCYEILAERAPDCFICHPKEFYDRVTNNVRPELPVSCPPLLSDCVKRCWHSEPSYRPSFAELSKILVYMKATLLVLDSHTIFKEEAILNKFIKNIDEDIDEGAVCDG